MTENIFDNPAPYLSEIMHGCFFSEEQLATFADAFSGKSILCAWLTKRCPLDCEFCFFRSNLDCVGLLPREHTLTEEGVEKLLGFVAQSDNGYLMISGGGDPFVELDAVCRIVREAQTSRLVLVTSGFWGTSECAAKYVVARLVRALEERDAGRIGGVDVVLRLSVDADHRRALGFSMEPYRNIINVFDSGGCSHPRLSLAIHTMRDDETMRELAKLLSASYRETVAGESDNDVLIKIVPQKAELQLPSGRVFPVAVSKVFLSDLMVDLRNPRSSVVGQAIRVFVEDMERSEQDNPSYAQNSLGKKGFDFWVDYNGNVTTWFNQDRDGLFNLYVDGYADVVRGTLSNPATLSFLRKGFLYRNRIVEEVNPRAVLRSIAINLRDYAAAALLEERHTKLYYCVRVIQDMISECFIDEEVIERELSASLCQAILELSQHELSELYAKSSYDVLLQELDPKAFKEEAWADLFALVALGHYEVSSSNLSGFLRLYEERSGISVKAVEDFLSIHEEGRYERLHMRHSRIKEDALL